MRQRQKNRPAAALAAILWLAFFLVVPKAQGQDSSGARRIQLQTFSIEAPAGEEWTTSALPERDSVAFIQRKKSTLGLFGTDQLISLVAQRIDSRYTLHGEMLSKKEALEYFRSGYAEIFQRRLPGSGLTSLSMDSVNWGGNEFRSVVVAIRGNGAGSRGQMFTYFPPGYEARKASYRFVVTEIAQAGFVFSSGPDEFKTETVLGSFRLRAPLEGYADEGGNLARAAASGDSALVRSLVEKGANVNARTVEGTPLTLASRGGYLSIVQYLLKSGARQEPDACGGEDTPLHAAIDGRAMNVASYLLERGANVNAVVKDSWTPLMEAVCTKADTSFIAGLIKRGANVDMAEAHSVTSLYMAAHIGAADVAAVLLDHGASARPKMGVDWSPFLQAVIQGHASVVRAMLDRGVGPDEKRTTGWTALMVAASAGELEMARLLVERGAKINAADETDRSALHVAIQDGRPHIAQFLIEKGADVNARMEKGVTPLMLAASKGDTVVVRALIQRKADLDLKDDEGDTALEIADDNDQDTVVALLKAAGARD